MQIDIVKDDEGEWVTVVRRKQRRKNKWNKLQMENFKRFGDPYLMDGSWYRPAVRLANPPAQVPAQVPIPLPPPPPPPPPGFYLGAYSPLPASGHTDSEFEESDDFRSADTTLEDDDDYEDLEGEEAQAEAEQTPTPTPGPSRGRIPLGPLSPEERQLLERAGIRTRSQVKLDPSVLSKYPSTFRRRKK